MFRISRTILANAYRFLLPGLGAAFVFAGLVAVVFLWVGEVKNTFTNVDVEWSQNIRRLGIEPFYPPQEDIAVGDLYADVAPNASTNLSEWPFVAHSVKLAHIDLSKEVQENYSNKYIFPETSDYFESIDKGWKQKPSVDSVFSTLKDRKTLPLALFPGLTVARTHIESGGFRGYMSRISGYIGLSKQESQSIDLRIPFAETYGVPSIPATRKLALFCSEEETKNYCSDEFARNQISMIVGDRIFEKVPDSNNFKFNIELTLVRTVYMARSIESVSVSEIELKSEAEVRSDIDRLALEVSSFAQIARTDAIDKNDLFAVKRIDEQRDRLQDLMKKMPPKGAAVSARSTDGHKIIARQVFQRPIVFGFRAVRYALEP